MGSCSTERIARRSRRRLAAVGLGWVLATAVAAAGAAPREFRAFAVAYRHDTERVQTYQTFSDSVRAQFAAAIAPNLRADAPNLVSYPENSTLMAYMVGSRGTASRAAVDEAGAIASLAGLAGPYAPQIGYYQARFPGTTAPGQLLQLALTDTLARLVMETFAPLAAEYHVYLSVSSNLAPFERITGPEAAVLADPDLNVDYAYRATSAQVLNRNFVFGPDGTLIAVQDKAYLVPVERDQGAGLGLVGIETSGIPVLDLPFARIGTVISKDAWMLDANDRLDQLGAEVLIQPEAFDTWGVGGDDLWPPDKFQRGGWWMVQKLPAVRANITAMLTGNLGDLRFDGQPLIAVEGPAGDPALCLMGQAPEPGWAAVGRWADLDEPAAALCDPARRPELESVGLALQPGSGDARENSYAEDVVFADLQLPARPAPARRLPPGPGAGAAPGSADTAQMLPRLSANGDTIWLNWIDSFGEPNQNLAISRLTAAGWSQTQRPAPTDPTGYDHFDNQWAPAPLALADGLLLGYIAFPTENWDVLAVRLEADGRGGDPVRIDDADAGSGVTRERGHSSLRLIDLDDGRIAALWSDLRWPWIKPQARLAISDDGGASWNASLRADGGPLTFEDGQLDARDPGESRGQSYPDAAPIGDGRLLIAWQEPDADGATRIWGRVMDATAPVERLSNAGGFRPRLLAGADGTVWLIYEQRTAQGGSVLYWRERTGAGTWTAERQLDPTALPEHTQRMAAPVLANGAPLVLYADDRAGDGDILAIAIGGTAPMRLDDAADGVDSLAPTAALRADGQLVAAWQDETADGPRLNWTLAPVITPPAGAATNVVGGSPGRWLLLALALLAMAKPPRNHPGLLRRLAGSHRGGGHPRR